MSAIIAAIVGFLGSTMPEVFRVFQERRDNAHELKILELQMQQQAQGHTHKLEEINATADIAETKAIYKTYNTNIKWVDALNGTVRPVLAYSFFGLYVFVKTQQAVHTPWQLWQGDDMAIFMGIITFYFGQRSMHKWRKGK